MIRNRQTGQATVELVAALPLILVVLACGWQVVVTGHTWWKLQEAARISARARFVAEQQGDVSTGLRKAKSVASSLLGGSPRASRRVQFLRDGSVEVSARAPLIEPFRSALGDSAGPKFTAKSRMRP